MLNVTVFHTFAANRTATRTAFGLSSEGWLLGRADLLAGFAIAVRRQACSDMPRVLAKKFQLI